MTEPSPFVKLLVILGVAKVTGERQIDYTKQTLKQKKKLPSGSIVKVIGIAIFITIAILTTQTLSNKDKITIPEIQSSEPILLSLQECLDLQGDIESQASEFPDADYVKWQNSNCVKVCQEDIEINKYYKKQDFITFLKDGCPYRKIILTNQECEIDKATDERKCKKIILGEVQ